MTIEEFKDKRKFIERLESIKNFSGEFKIRMNSRCVSEIEIWEGEIDNEPFKLNGETSWWWYELDLDYDEDEKIGGILKLIDLLNNYDVDDLNSEILWSEFNLSYSSSNNGTQDLDYQNIKFTNKISSEREEILKGKIEDSYIGDIAELEETTMTFGEYSIDEILVEFKDPSKGDITLKMINDRLVTLKN